MQEHLTELVTAQAGSNAPLSNRRDWKYHAERISAAWGKQVESIIETGKCLIEARDELQGQSFRSMIQAKLPFEKSTAYALIKIAEHPIVGSVQHVGQLPPSWGTLLELTKLSPRAPAREAQGWPHLSQARTQDRYRLVQGGARQAGR